MASSHHDARNHMGRYRRTPETVTQDAEAARLYNEENLTYREIAEHFGWSSHVTALRAVQRAYRDLAAPAAAGKARREQELDFLWEAASEILGRDHLVVSHGRIIEGVDGTPLVDDGPKLQAIEQLRKVNESRRKLDGDDAPSRVSVEAEQLGRDILRLLDAALGPDGDSDDPDA